MSDVREGGEQSEASCRVRNCTANHYLCPTSVDTHLFSAAPGEKNAGLEEAHEKLGVLHRHPVTKAKISKVKL